MKSSTALLREASIRSTERLTGVHRDTICRLLVDVGDRCSMLLDSKMQNLSCERIQIDEIWAYIKKKQRNVTFEDDQSRVGDAWTFVAIDPDTKLIPAHCVGRRDAATANAFIADLSDRLAHHVQISSDALRVYVEAIEDSFGADVDYGQIVTNSTPNRTISGLGPAFRRT